jgi:hypothetical protein
MTSVDQEMAISLILNDGNYPGDPQAYAVVRYTAFNHFSFKIVYNSYELKYNMDSFNERNMLPKVIWKKGMQLTRRKILSRIRALITNKDMEYPYQD